jgi:antitoxin component of RelBE/YafQ-DinJ toxin-antitoxin module
MGARSEVRGVLSLRVNEAERLRLRQVAAALGLSPSECIRALVEAEHRKVIGGKKSTKRGK